MLTKFVKRPWLLAAIAIASAGVAAQAQPELDFHSEAALISESPTFRPGSPFTVALRITLEKGWHTYWRNPGDSGYPIRINWRLPTGFKAGPAQWPAPRRIQGGSLVSYGYEDEVWLLYQLTPPANWPAGRDVTLGASAEWLACEEECVPASSDLSLKLKASAEPSDPDPKWAARFSSARARLPIAANQAGYTVRAEKSASGKQWELRIGSPSAPPLTPQQIRAAYFFNSERGLVSNAAPQTTVLGQQAFRLRIQPGDEIPGSGIRLKGVLTVPTSTGLPLALAIDTPLLATSKK